MGREKSIILFKGAVMKYMAIVLIVLGSLVSGTISYSAEDVVPSAFFDVKAYVNELRLKVNKISPGVVLVVFYDITGDEAGSGSGFFIDLEGRFLTNAANLKDAYSAEVFSESNYYNEVIIINRDEKQDLALMKVNAVDEVPLEMDFEDKLQIGEGVIIVGKSRALEKKVSKGEIREVKRFGDTLEVIKLKTALTVSFQRSYDGPLLNMSGKVIGLATVRALDNKVFGLDALKLDDKQIDAVSIHSINSFLSEPGEVEHLQPAKSRVWSKFVLDRIQEIAVNGFVALYSIGFSKILGNFIKLVLLIALIQWIYNKTKKRFNKKET